MLTHTTSSPEFPFTQVYHGVRKKESRLYCDSQVAALPDIDRQHPHAAEWKLRQQSAERLLKYLKEKNAALQILEVGCGNGWLSARMASLPGISVLGIDPHEPEIRQANRVFKGQRLRFATSTFPAHMAAENFDIIVFAASFQYFSDATAVLEAATARLKPGGEIHIIDSIFYAPLAVAGARERSRSYFSGLGWPAMTEHYFHHSLPRVDGLKAKMVFDPAGLVNRLFRPSPFPWIRFSKTGVL